MICLMNPFLKPLGARALITLFVALHFLCPPAAKAQSSRYWDQTLNSEAALLSNAVVAGESSVAAIYYNPATISEMKRNNLSLSANLFSVSFSNAENALGADFPADRTQLDVYPRIITLTVNPKKRPDLTIEIAYFAKTNNYIQINQGTSLMKDIILSHPGDEQYTAEYYARSKFEDYYGGFGFGYKLTNSLAIGFSGMVSYKDDQFYNLVTAEAFSVPDPEQGATGQYLSGSRYHSKFNMFDVRVITKAGMTVNRNSWAIGVNINFPSIKVFGDGTVVKQFGYSNIHKEAFDTEGTDVYYAGRQRKCKSHFKDPLSVSAGANYYSPSRNSILLFTAEYFFGLPEYKYIEASQEPGDNGYNFSGLNAADWLSYNARQVPVFNIGVAYRQQLSEKLMFSGGFRTDFTCLDLSAEEQFPYNNRKTYYTYNVYHINYGFGYQFKRGSIILGMQFSHGDDQDQRQIVNLTEPVEYIDDSVMPLTGEVKNNVQIHYNDISVYLGFMFNFLKD